MRKCLILVISILLIVLMLKKLFTFMIYYAHFESISRELKTLIYYLMQVLCYFGFFYFKLIMCFRWWNNLQLLYYTTTFSELWSYTLLISPSYCLFVTTFFRFLFVKPLSP